MEPDEDITFDGMKSWFYYKYLLISWWLQGTWFKTGWGATSGIRIICHSCGREELQYMCHVTSQFSFTPKQRLILFLPPHPTADLADISGQR